MDTLSLRVTPSDSAASLDTLNANADPLGWRGTLRHPVVAFQRMFHIEFELNGLDLCDGDSLHADLVELFERSSAPTARPQA